MTIRQTPTGCFEAKCDDCGTSVTSTRLEGMLTETANLGWHFDRNADPIAHYCPQCCLKMTDPTSEVDLVAFNVSVMPGGRIARGGDDPILGAVVQTAQPKHEATVKAAERAEAKAIENNLDALEDDLAALDEALKGWN